MEIIDSAGSGADFLLEDAREVRSWSFIVTELYKVRVGCNLGWKTNNGDKIEIVGESSSGDKRPTS